MDGSVCHSEPMEGCRVDTWKITLRAGVARPCVGHKWSPRRTGRGCDWWQNLRPSEKLFACMFWSSRLKDFLINTVNKLRKWRIFQQSIVTIHSISPQGWFHGHGAFYTIDKMRFEGEFRGGRIWGNGLITYPDETPGIEGYFQDARWDRFGISEYHNQIHSGKSFFKFNFFE